MDSLSKLCSSPVKSCLKNKMLLKNTSNCDSPLSYLPNVSTPPSRSAKIRNPFESQLLDRLHLPMFSPNVFATRSTPKTDEKFKWTIDDISSLKPADIDEATIDLHVSEHDPTMETAVQERINKFFNDKAIVPSPLNEQIIAQNLFIETTPNHEETSHTDKLPMVDGIAQTVLTLPPILSPDLEVLLKPYYTYITNQQQSARPTVTNSPLYRKLFESPDKTESVQSSPVPTDLSLSSIEFSPVISQSHRFSAHPNVYQVDQEKQFQDCSLSPVFGPDLYRCNSVEDMSVERTELVLPNAASTSCVTMKSVTSLLMDDDEMMRFMSPDKHSSVLMTTNDNTPLLRRVTTPRKRLSTSFVALKDELYTCAPDDIDGTRDRRRINHRLFAWDALSANNIDTGSEERLLNVCPISD